MIRANGRKVAYGIKHFNLDTENDFSKLNGYVLVPGCTAFVIETSTRYILNSKMEWVEIQKYSGGTSGGGSSGDGSIDGDYDGGSIDGTDPEGSTDGDGYYDGGSIDGTDPIQ